MRELVLTPAGITRMKLGKTRLADRAEGEVIYHMREGDRLYRSVFPEVQELVEEPYGSSISKPWTRTVDGSLRRSIWSALPRRSMAAGRRRC